MNSAPSSSKLNSDFKSIAVLGSTGSIGTQTLDVVRRLPHALRVHSLAAGSNLALLRKQAQEFKVKTAALVKANDPRPPTDNLPDGVQFLYGPESLVTLATDPSVDIVVVAVDGAIGTRATVAALLAGKTVALATKEVLVAAGEIVTKAAVVGGGRLVPIDSEHSAVFQCIQGAPSGSVRKIWLTASGGPFRNWTADQIAGATVEDALKHPTWQMGRKITIDSATMMNKGLETIEARWLFDLSIHQVQVVVHPQSTVHALVEFNDGAVIAQLGNADMRLPIEYALLWPKRVDIGLQPLDILKLNKLEFEPPDETKFPCLRLAREAAIAGGTAPAVLNGANETAVREFLAGRLTFDGIAKVVETALEYHISIKEPNLEEVLAADEWSRQFVSEVAVQ